MTTETPAQAPYPVEGFLYLSSREQSISALAISDKTTTLPCNIPVHVGLFFDGTNNNMKRDLNGKRISVVIDPKTKKPAPMPNRKMAVEQCSHSNVVRLFRAFPDKKQSSGYYSLLHPRRRNRVRGNWRANRINGRQGVCQGWPAPDHVGYLSGIERHTQDGL